VPIYTPLLGAHTKSVHGLAAGHTAESFNTYDFANAGIT
jgi:hypothetical protein